MWSIGGLHLQQSGGGDSLGQVLKKLGSTPTVSVGGAVQHGEQLPGTELEPRSALSSQEAFGFQW